MKKQYFGYFFLFTIGFAAGFIIGVLRIGRKLGWPFIDVGVVLLAIRELTRSAGGGML
jgi:hypothetical protein